MSLSLPLSRPTPVKWSRSEDPIRVHVKPHNKVVCHFLVIILHPLGSAEIPIIMAGDFNSEPDSAAHRLLVHGRVDTMHKVKNYLHQQ